MSFFFNLVFQWFLISLSVLPGNCAAIIDHLHLPETVLDETIKYPHLKPYRTEDGTCLRLVNSHKKKVPKEETFELIFIKNFEILVIFP